MFFFGTRIRSKTNGVSRVMSDRDVVALGMGAADGYVNPILPSGVGEGCNDIHHCISSLASGRIAKAKLRYDSLIVDVGVGLHQGFTQCSFEEFVLPELCRTFGAHGASVD